MRPATLLKERLWRRCFPVNFVKFLRTPFCIEHLWWLLLQHQYQQAMRLCPIPTMQPMKSESQGKKSKKPNCKYAQFVVKCFFHIFLIFFLSASNAFMHSHGFVTLGHIWSSSRVKTDHCNSIVKWGYQDNFKPAYFFLTKRFHAHKKHKNMSQVKIS